MKYDPARQEIMKSLSVIEDMQNDSEDDYACKKNDMRPQQFRSILSSWLKKCDIAVDDTPEERVYELLFNMVSPDAYPSNFDQTIPCCMEKYLNDEEKDILTRIYWNNETYDTFSQDYQTNSSNIKKLARNAFKKL